MYNANQEEEKILKFWEENNSFEKSVENRSEDKTYHFYDGPPFATGLPHYGHIVASLMKDIVPRFWTMRGFKVERKWGWDCHGLPIENIVEKDLGISGKKDIEDYGVEKFNTACHSTVMKYAGEWRQTVRQMGRWVDMDNDYKTMDLSFMESVWWVFKELWQKDLIYKGYKPMHICPRCVTPLSNFEVTQEYKDIKDISVTAKFKLKNPEKLGVSGDVYVLAWTTTPWTLPGNVALAVNPEINYVVFKRFTGNWDVQKKAVYENVVLAKEIFEEIKKDPASIKAEPFHLLFDKVSTGYDVPVDYSDSTVEVKGKELLGMEYEPLFPYFADTEKAFRIVSGDFVTTEDGTGVVHIAPAFGEDDFEVGKREEIPLVQHVTMEGRFIDEVKDFAGMEVKPADDLQKTDVEILKWLAKENKLFSKQKFEHSYPHCWRCEAPLLNYATTSWFVKVSEIKNQLLKNNADTSWVPAHIKDGRFGKWLEGARDWAISRNRYWGTPLPVWESEDGEHLCVGSVAELEELSGQKIKDLHKHNMDKIVVTKDGKEYKKIPEVLDCWFESGSMPYAQMHYPFANKEKFERGFPAEFIAEGQDQTRGWFYTLHVLATALTTGDNPSIPVKKSVPAFKHVIVNGIVLAEDGKKMSKRLKNYPDPGEVMGKFGADAMRYYLATSPVMQAETLNFSEAGVREIYNKVVNTLSNVKEFYDMYAGSSQKSQVKSKRSNNILDKWVLAKLQQLILDVEKGMNEYKIVDASRPILEFITELSQWYVRRSRDRFKGDDGEDKKQAVATLREVLLILSKVMAPFTPFIAEKIYLSLTDSQESVHLCDWPEANKDFVDEGVIKEMTTARQIVEATLALRAEAGMKVRQPLNTLFIVGASMSPEVKVITAEELNVKEIEEVKKIKEQEGIAVKVVGNLSVGLNVVLTDNLKKEGLVREIVRTINQLRKEQKLTMSDEITVAYNTSDELLKDVLTEFAEEIKKQTLTRELKSVSNSLPEKNVSGMTLGLSLSVIPSAVEESFSKPLS